MGQHGYSAVVLVLSRFCHKVRHCFGNLLGGTVVPKAVGGGFINRDRDSVSCNSRKSQFGEAVREPHIEAPISRFCDTDSYLFSICCVEFGDGWIGALPFCI